MHCLRLLCREATKQGAMYGLLTGTERNYRPDGCIKVHLPRHGQSLTQKALRLPPEAAPQAMDRESMESVWEISMATDMMR